MDDDERGCCKGNFGPYDPPELDDNRLRGDLDVLQRLAERSPGCLCCPYCCWSVCNVPAPDFSGCGGHGDND